MPTAGSSPRTSASRVTGTPLLPAPRSIRRACTLHPALRTLHAAPRIPHPAPGTLTLTLTLTLAHTLTLTLTLTSQAAVLQLIASRAAAKKERDYPAADAAAAALLEQHAVVLEDKRGTWRVVQLLSGFYRVGPTPEPRTADAVPPLLAALAAAREDGANREANARLDELEGLGVSVDEPSRTWRISRSDAGGRLYPARPRAGEGAGEGGGDVGGGARGRGRGGGRGGARGRGGGW